LEKSNLLPNGLLSERYYRLIEKQEDRQVMKVEFHTVLKKKEEIITDWFFNYTTAYLYNDQLPEILKRNGLFPESTYCDYDKTSFNACSNPQRQIFIIKKSGIMKSDNRIVIAMKSYYRERKAANDPDLEFLPFIKKNNFAYLMGVIYNQGMSADHTWKIPQMLHKRIGFFTVIDFAKVDLKNIEDAFYTRPSLHRYWKTMARYTKQAALKLVDEYAGETGNIWNDKPAVDTLYNRLLSFKGIGPKKANMAIRALALSFGIKLLDPQNIDLPVDVHVRRVFLRTGLVHKDSSEDIIIAARKLNPSLPAKLDLPTWLIGRRWCHATAPDCSNCVLAGVCRKKTKLNVASI